MSYFYNELKKDSSTNTYLQKNHIPITIKRKYRKKNKRGTFLAEVSGLYQDYAKIRAKIAGKSSPRLMLRLHYVFTMRLIYTAVLCVSLLFTQYMPVFAGAVSVPREARDTAENAKMAAQAVIDKEQSVLDRLNTEEYVEDAVAVVNYTEERIKEAETIASQKRQEAQQLRAKAQTVTQDAEAAAAKAARDRAEAEKATAASNNAGKDAKNIEDGSKLRIEDISKTAAKKLDELDSKEEDVSEKQLREVADNALREIEKLQGETEGAINVAYERADRLAAVADSLEAKAELSEQAADKKLEEAELARDMAEQAAEEAVNAQEMYNELLANLAEAKGEEKTARNELSTLIREQNNPKGSHYFGASINYYSWSDSQGGSGHQISKPFFYGYSQKEYSYGMSANHINSKGSDRGSGSVSTFTDVTVSADKRTETEKYIFNYGLDVNVPTGKPTLSWPERYAMMTEDLVELGQFGKGWQFTPRFAVSKKINKEDTLTFATSYSFNSSYDPTSDIPNDSITPGSEWMKKLRWQHAGQDWQFVGELIHTSSSPSKVSNGSSYPIASAWEQRLTYNRKLNETQDLMFYFWREESSSNAVLPTDSKEAANNYFGTMWSKKLNEKRTFRLAFDVMKSNGSHYSHMTNLGDRYTNPQYNSVSVEGRTKYTIGAIYDYKLDKDSKITAEVQTFTMKDGSSTAGKPSADYNGVNVFLTYNKIF